MLTHVVGVLGLMWSVSSVTSFSYHYYHRAPPTRSFPCPVSYHYKKNKYGGISAVGTEQDKWRMLEQQKWNVKNRLSMVSGGLTFFDDGDDLLMISAQKPLGLLLEEEFVLGNKNDIDIVVVEVDANGAAYRAGVRVGDVIRAVQNQDTSNDSLKDVMDRIAAAPRIVNLRFYRPPSTQ